MENHLAVYGSVRIPRVYCKKCKGMTLVIDNIKQCCDTKIKDIFLKNTKRMCGGESRGRPSAFLRRKILELQGNKCLYCEQRFGSFYVRNKKIIALKLHFDHLIPYAYSQENKYNFVAACNICNGIKSDKIFQTVEEVYHYVKYNREKKGIQYLTE